MCQRSRQRDAATLMVLPSTVCEDDQMKHLHLLAITIMLQGLGLGCGDSDPSTGAGGSGTGAAGAGGPGSGASGGAGASGSGASGGAGGGAFASCDGPGQCTLAVPGCCGVCGAPTIEDVEPIHSTNAQAFFDATCTEEDPTCPGCATFDNPNLFATCEAGTCTKHNLPSDDFSLCEQAGDCTLRLGTGCCDCNDGTEWVAIAVSATDDLAAAVCDPLEACPDCAPMPPDTIAADCQNGHCVVVEL